ncbi:glycosyltransferase [Patescibacteria group bacterium]|nr:glycosyltransferase [Patescibacteria group bacterium]
MPDLNYVATVYNGLDIKRFEFKKKHKNYLAFLGRFSFEKGVDTAVKVAAKSGEKIKIAGNIWGNGFYNEKVEPHLKKGEIENVGLLGKDKLSDFLGGAKALLFPIRWEEPFGLVMIEAMACGVPVIAFNRGSVSEVVKHGKTGFIVENEEEMIEAIKNIDKIDREECRKHVEENFTVEKMVDGYENAYRKILNKK